MATSSVGRSHPAGRPRLFDLSARLWMRAYPRRWRATYGADLLGMLADVAPVGARTVPVREGLAVLRAGWALRWREHPQFWPWLAYRTFDRRLPYRYRCWVIDDLLGPLYEVRIILTALLIFLSIMVVPGLLVGESYAPPSGTLGFLTVWCAFAVFLARAVKFQPRRVWDKNVGGDYPTALLPLWRRAAVRRSVRSKS